MGPLVMLALCCALGSALCSGCGGPKTFPVAGRVAFADGEVVQSGKIEFRGVDHRWTAVGDIDRQGRFELRSLDGVEGVPAGRYDVVVVQVIMTEDLSLAAHNHGRLVPPKYADYFTSGLQVDVSESNARSISIALEVPPKTR